MQEIVFLEPNKKVRMESKKQFSIIKTELCFVKVLLKVYIY